ncbi:MAG: arsenic transporter [Clostridia bacterium]|nr:arsenic transporter [Clostridia bacterium]
MLTALIIFIAMYVGMFVFPKLRVWFAVAGGAAMLAFRVLPIGELAGAIDWNVIMMIAGTMGIVALFIETGMPARLADLMLKRVKSAGAAVVLLSVFAGVVSAFIDNVATVLMIAPVGLAIAKKLDMNPVPVIISIAVSSNLQGAATLVGDTPSLMLGGYAKMSFVDFIWWHGKPSIFWAVELGALCTVLLLIFLFRKEKNEVTSSRMTEVTDYGPSVLLIAVVVLLIIASFFEIPVIDDVKNGIICLSLCLIGIVHGCLKRKSASSLKLVIKEMDFATLFMLAGLFVVIAGIKEAGIIDAIADWFAGLGGSIFLLYTVIVFASVLISAFVDNIPYVAAMLPVVQGIALKLGIDPIVLYFGLLSGATLGGNITPFGASANVAGIGILRKEGYEVKNSDFFRIGIPFTLTAVLVGYAFIWIVWS